MQEEDRIINSSSPLYEEFGLNELPTDLIIEDTSSIDCCSSSSPTSITIDPRNIPINKDIQAKLNYQGRLLLIRVFLKGICPNKKIAIGVLLFDKNNVIKGFKVKEIVVPPPPTSHPGENCKDVVVCKFCFVLPSPTCSPLTLTAKVIAHYTDLYIDL